MRSSADCLCAQLGVKRPNRRSRIAALEDRPVPGVSKRANNTSSYDEPLEKRLALWAESAEPFSYETRNSLFV